MCLVIIGRITVYLTTLNDIDLKYFSQITSFKCLVKSLRFIETHTHVNYTFMYIRTLIKKKVTSYLDLHKQSTYSAKDSLFDV